jgi:hypothetical protein
MLRKNVAGQSVFFVLINSTTGAPLTGATVTVNRALDTAAQAAATGAVTELGSGQYRFDASQADTNADFLGYLFSATSAISVGANFVTTANNPHDAAAGGLTNLDTTISSRMATYAQPAGFLAAVFPSDPADQSLVIAATDAITTAVAAVQADTDNIQTRLPAALVGGRMDSSVGAMAANVLTASALAADAVAEIADGVWDETTSGHTTLGTFGQGAYQIRSGTAQSGAFNILQLDAGASALDDFYNNQLLVITGGTGTGQARHIYDYDGATRNALVIFIWDVAPDATSQFVILPGGVVGVPVPTIAEFATAVWDEFVDGTTRARAAMCLHNSAMGGKASGLGTVTAVYRDLADTKNRITATVDADGNRSAVVLDLTP